MKSTTKCRLLAGLILLGMLLTSASAQNQPNTLAPKEAAAGWKLLFDGSTLNGWEPHMASATEPAATWGVADGAIFCTGNKRGWLGSADLYTDFNLKVDFRAGAKINSGVFLRSQKEGGIPAETGYELQIWDFRPTFKTGSLVGSLEAEPSKVLADQCNSYDITVQGDHFIVVLNGKKVLDGRNTKHLSAGVVGLQYNTGGGKIEFRNIKIRPLKP